MPLAPGAIFAGYTIVRLLGAGGMGEVYLARHPRLPREDALKVLPTELSADGEYRARFNREADLAATLWHPHIVGIHDRGEHDGQLWIAMDFVDGRDAAQLLAERHSDGMPTSEVTEIVTAIASALDYASTRGLLHRDVKPANVMIAQPDENGQRRILLADFGIARPTGDTGGLTTTNMTVGTVAYCAPEQLMGEQLDGRADLYALAATAYQLLSGSLLFSDSNPAVVISRQLNAPPPSLAATRPDLAALDPVMATALAKNPADRFPRCSDFARALAAQATAHGTAKKASMAQTERALPATLRTANPHPRHRWVVVAAALTVAIVCAALVVVWHPWGHNKTGPAQVPSARATGPVNPPNSTFPAIRIDDALLGTDALSRAVGVSVTAKPTLDMNETYGNRHGALNLDSSSYGTQDHSRLVKPAACVGVAYTDEHATYTKAKTDAVKTQTFTGSWDNSDGRPHTPVRLEQTAVILPSADDARRLVTAAQNHWASCAKTEVDVTLGFEDSWSYHLGDVRRQGDVLTVSMVTGGPFIEWFGCEQVMGARTNVVVEVRSCNFLFASSDRQPEKLQWQNDPAWKLNSADAVAGALLEQVKT